MHSNLTLARTSSHIISYINPGQPEAGDIDEEIMHTLSNLQRIFPEWTICTCRFMHTGFFYVSDNCKSVLGLEAEVLVSAFKFDNYFRRLHPADMEDFIKCVELIGELIKKEDPADHHKLRYVFNYRVQHADGRYVYVHDEKANLVLKNKQNLYYMLLRDISQETPYSGVRLSVYKRGNDNKKILEYSSMAETAGRLSRRENELIPLMKQGLSTKEIAYHLDISPHTVRNMRQKLFEKFQVNNAIELLNKVDAATESTHKGIVATVKGWDLASAV